MTQEMTPSSPAGREHDPGIDLSRLGWGLALVAIGGLFLLARLEIFNLHGVWRFFPLIPATLGLIDLVRAETAERRHSALWLIGISSWLLINTLSLYGFWWSNSWPLIVIMAGIIDFIQPKAGERRIDGFWPFAIGIWLLVNVLQVGGLRWSTSWPVLLVIVGLAIVFKALAAQVGWNKKGGGSDAF